MSLIIQMGGKLLTEEKDNLKNKFYEDIMQKVNVTVEDVIKQVAKSLPNYGVGLYKATDNNLNNWNKLIVNPNTKELEEIPCN